MKFKQLLGLNFIDEDVVAVANHVAELVASPGPRQHYVVTPNPEIMLKAWADPQYMKVLRHADFCIADGFGLLWADWFRGKFKGWSSVLRKMWVYPSVLWFLLFVSKQKVIHRVTGVDLMEKLLIWQEKMPVFLLGARTGVAEEVVKNFPFANIVGTYAGEADLLGDSDTRDHVREAHPTVVFVAYGAPKQEFWIDRNLKNLPKLKLAIGVGGAFDFLAGEASRAPLFLRKVGIEWLFRLIFQPWRWRRIFNAVVVFPWRVACLKPDSVL